MCIHISQILLESIILPRYMLDASRRAVVTSSTSGLCGNSSYRSLMRAYAAKLEITATLSALLQRKTTRETEKRAPHEVHAHFLVTTSMEVRLPVLVPSRHSHQMFEPGIKITIAAIQPARLKCVFAAFRPSRLRFPQSTKAEFEVACTQAPSLRLQKQ